MLSKSKSNTNPIYKLAKARAALMGDVQEDKANKRKAFIQMLLEEGGKPFVRALATAKNDKGERLILYPWFVEYSELIADVRVAEITTSGCAQCGKSLTHNLLLAYLVIDGSLNLMFAFPLRQALIKVVAAMQRPLLEMWAKARGLFVKKNETTQNISTWGINGGNVFFTYTSTSSSSSEGSAAGSAVVSVSVDFVMADEISQHAAGSVDVLARRMDAGRIPTQPIRRIGTPGSGAGAEMEIERSQYNFYPHAVCEHCQTTIPLHPFGCLIRPSKKELPNGEVITSFVSDSGRPSRWFHKQPDNPVGSACFACPHCCKAISDENRVYKSFFQCLKSGVKLRDFLDGLKGVPEQRLRVGITLSPLLREAQFNLAEKLIRAGLETGNTADWSQQALGVASTSGGAAISEAQIRASVMMPRRDRKHDFIIAGIDQGRGGDTVVIVGVSKPDNHKLSTEQIYDQSSREILFSGFMERADIPELLRTYDVDYGLIDSEPDISSSADLCDITCLDSCDQQAKQLDSYITKMIKDGGKEYPCIKIRSYRFLRDVQRDYTTLLDDGYPKIKSPDNWETWFSNPTELSPVRHLQNVSFNAETGKWDRESSHQDHTYYALHFASAAIFIYLNEHEIGNNWFDYV